MALLPLALLTLLLVPLRRLTVRGWLRETGVDGLLRHAHPLAPLNRHYAWVETCYWVAGDMFALALRTTPGRSPARPGQRTQPLVECDGVRVGRSYSLTQVVGECLETAVEHHPGGLSSPWSCEHLAVDQCIELQPTQDDSRWPMQVEAAYLLAVDNGLTPLLGPLREVLENDYRGPVLWLHYARHPGQRARLGELEALTTCHSNLELRRSLTRKVQADDYPEGHFQPRYLGGWTADLARSQALACGSAVFIEAVGEQLGTRFAGLQTESFSVPRRRNGEAPREARLCFVRSQWEASDDSVASPLKQAEAYDLCPAHGYRQGICASCTCALLSGCVRDLCDDTLCSEPGRSIRLCASAAHGDLALDL